MRLPRQPYSWDEGDDHPIPADLLGDSVEASDEPIARAEMVVREAQDAIAREDTDPAIPVARQLVVDASFDRDSRLPKRALVAVGCVLAFSHGWITGASSGSGYGNACSTESCASVPAFELGRAARS